MYPSLPDHPGNYCYSCLSIDLIGKNESWDDPFLQVFRGLRVNFLFDGVDPGGCANPYLKKCEDDQPCLIFQARGESICTLPLNALPAKLFELEVEVVAR